MDGAAGASAVGAGPLSGRLAPSALTGMADALRAAGGERLARRVFEAAGLGALLDHPLPAPVDERLVLSLHARVAESFEPALAAALVEEAGRRAADAFVDARVPVPVQWLAAVLPWGLAARLTLAILRRHARGFVGSGGLRAWIGHGPARCVLEIAANPIALPGCHWHRGVFARLFQRLVRAEAQVIEDTCSARPGDPCRFEIRY